MNNKKAVFLRAYQRSGTNWLCNLLNLHPEIKCTGEFHFKRLFDAFQQSKAARFDLFAKHPNIFRQEFFRFINRTVIKYCEDAPVCIDRTPEGISDTFIPGHKYIYLARDGRDIVVSWCYHLLRLELNQNPIWKKRNSLFKKDPMYFEENKHELLEVEGFVRHIAKKWNKRIKLDLDWMEQAKKGEKNFQYYFVQYKDLHAETDKHRNEIYTFLELDPSKAKPLDNMTTAGFKRKKEIDTQSHYRKGKVGGWQDYFTDQQLKWFYEEASEAIELLNLSK